MNIGANGVVFEQDATTGCVIGGQVSIINATYNAYAIQLSISGCASPKDVLNGLTLTGLATLDTTASPTALLGGVNGNLMGTTIALAFDIPVM
jgi:hypothetical protein